jgi:hypothetical protein
MSEDLQHILDTGNKVNYSTVLMHWAPRHERGPPAYPGHRQQGEYSTVGMPLYTVNKVNYSTVLIHLYIGNKVKYVQYSIQAFGHWQLGELQYSIHAFGHRQQGELQYSFMLLDTGN